jgi:hypothetical protein
MSTRWFQSIDWIVVEIFVTSILCGLAIRSWWVAIGLFIVFAGLNARPDGRRSLATLAAFCWIGLGTTGWARFTGWNGGLLAGLAIGGAIFLAHSLAPAPAPVTPPETKAELHKAQVERAVRDVLVIAMILLALFGFFWAGASDHAAPAAKPPGAAVPGIKADI